MYASFECKSLIYVMYASLEQIVSYFADEKNINQPILDIKFLYIEFVKKIIMLLKVFCPKNKEQSGEHFLSKIDF